MTLTRIVSQDTLNDLQTDEKILAKLKVLLWRDPAIEKTLKALSHEGKICPVIEIWRNGLSTLLK